ncbi:hypothetical protein [Kaistia terrae]|uniref:Uncharacterized protein n=1 Tax=Kaistia terrae TaxID=537017 RepID=A0ABW0PZ57_9HYPH|nr:hypothetical protein [Kaistia terrae]MCX5579202.1 hypothetical protein [Kaistia terrae]
MCRSTMSAARLNLSAPVRAIGGYPKDVGGGYEEGIHGNLGLCFTW